LARAVRGARAPAATAVYRQLYRIHCHFAALAACVPKTLVIVVVA
jgi:hypothetical protein